VGSFLNVVIHRVPRDESLVRPGSHCPHCGNEVRNRHNIPVLGWLLLRGRCADCQAPISARYPLVEAGTAALFVAVAARFGWSWELPAYLYLAAITIALAAIDLDVLRLPDQIVLPSYAWRWSCSPRRDRRAQLGSGRSAACSPPRPSTRSTRLLALIPRGMGGGDVKLAPLLGFYLGWLGWSSVAVGAFAGFLLGGVVGTAPAAVQARHRKSRIPFGPTCWPARSSPSSPRHRSPTGTRRCSPPPPDLSPLDRGAPAA
jgi:leader peptidase (prepilin peptidase)/N-methyltransferase